MLHIYLEEIFDSLWVIAVALTADALHLFDLAGLAGSLDVLEVDLRVLAEVNNGAQEVEQTCNTQSDHHNNSPPTFNMSHNLKSSFMNVKFENY